MSLRILVVDDDAPTLKKARRLLQATGFRVAVARGGEEGLRAIAKELPAIVLSDVTMAGVTGIDILEAAKKKDPDTPVILMTGPRQVETAIAAVERGAFQYIHKPLRREELVVMCRRAAETRRLKREIQRLRMHVVHKDALLEADRVTAPGSGDVPRPERKAMERAALKRVTELMNAAVARAPIPVLERALAEPAPSGTLADVFADMVLADPVHGEWSAALLRGAQAQRQLLEEAGGALTADQVGELLGIGRAAVDKRRRHGNLLGLKLPSGDVVYPAAQLSRGAVLPGLAEAIGAFHIRDPWMQLEWLLARDEALDGRTAFEALAAGEVDRVKAFVASAGDQGL